MDIKQLEAFVHVVETCSFSKAGELLHLTQPTISSHILSLERELNIKLIVRTTKETYPSEAGKLLYNYAKEILIMRENAVQAIRMFSQEMRGTITVAASTIPGQYYLPKILQSFREKYPDIKFNIQMTDSSDVVDRITTRTAEVGFSGTEIDAPKCIYREFADDKLVVITPNEPRFRQYVGKGFPIRQIREEPFISRESGSGTRKETEAFLRELGINVAELKTAVEVRSTESIIKMVSEGMGVAVLSKSACEDYQQFGKVLAFDFDNITLRRKLYIIKHKNSILSPIAQVFYDYARNFYKK
ncbi:MAG: LysR family transcriptional regulator [Clostridia bacterium]|nr:LysR family transcriptional regulator [Clostridia bacterium]